MDAKKEIKVLDVDFIIGDIKRRIEYNEQQIRIRKEGIVNSVLSGGAAADPSVDGIREGMAANKAYHRVLSLLENIDNEYTLNENGVPLFASDQKASEKNKWEIS